MMRFNVSCKLLTLALVGALGAAPALAGEPPTNDQNNPSQRGDRGDRGRDRGPDGGGFTGGFGVTMLLQRSQEMVNELNLTPEQKPKIDAIFQKAATDHEAIKSDLEALPPQERMQQSAKFLQNVRDELNQTLDESQRAELEKKSEAARQNFRDRGGARGAGPATTQAARGSFTDQLRDNIAKLDLSEEQQAQVKTLLEEAQVKGQQLREELRTGGADARDKARQLFQETRDKLSAILTPEQRDKLRGMMQGSGPGGPMREPGDRGRDRGTQRAPSTRPTADAAMEMQSMQNMDMQMEGSGSERKAAPRSAAPPEAAVVTGPSPGDPVPSLTLRKLDGSVVQLTSLKGRVIVLEFGSYSSPSFRNRAAAMEKLRSDYGARVTFFVVYTREAHPAGEWDVARNKEDGISVEQPKTQDARKALATTARDKLKITVPILLDTPENEAATALGAGANSAYVIGRDGTIVARQQWFEPNALRRVLDTAAARAPLKPAA